MLNTPGTSCTIHGCLALVAYLLQCYSRRRPGNFPVGRPSLRTARGSAGKRKIRRTSSNSLRGFFIIARFNRQDCCSFTKTVLVLPFSSLYVQNGDHFQIRKSFGHFNKTAFIQTIQESDNSKRIHESAGEAPC